MRRLIVSNLISLDGYAARGPAGTTFLVQALPEVDGGPAKHLVLLLEQPVALLQLADLGLLGERQALAHAVFDLGALHPPMQTGLGDPEVLRDLGHRSFLAAGHAHDVSAELQGERLGHLLLLPVRVILTDQESTKPEADPRDVGIMWIVCNRHTGQLVRSRSLIAIDENLRPGRSAEEPS